MEVTPRNIKEELFSRIQSIRLVPIEKTPSGHELTPPEHPNSSSSSAEETSKTSNDEEWIVADDSNPEGITSEKNFDNDTKLFQSALSDEVIDITKLKCLTYKRTVPLKYRGVIWKLFLGYLPPRPSEWMRTVTPLRVRYFEKRQKFITNFESFDTWGKPQRKLYNEIAVDIPRTYLNGFRGLCKNPRITPIIARVLYIWSSENTISYYQGMCELVYMLFVTFLAEHPLAADGIQSLHSLDITAIEQEFFDNIEADTFYSFDALMNYYKSVFTEDVMQGTYELIDEITKILKISSPELSAHLSSLRCDTMDFSIRWIICMFVREFKVPIVMKLWDLLFSVGEYFPIYMLYLSASLVISFRDDLMKINEQSDFIIYMQKLDLNYWSDDEINALVTRANEILEIDLHRPLEYRFSFKPLNHSKKMYKDDFTKILVALYGNDTPVAYDDAKIGVTASLLAVTLIAASNSKRRKQ